ncbi:UNVERIFIED_CONTAM: hypothetical protein PYX00_011137 [Menopon gallinae]|uniref:Solute-binding protein family 5 domain-containing protein n=1 Tax=Menopon gallinae TaxID=328185 RepID=A0AAW2H683_9NEOP
MFQDPRVALALNMAIDRDFITQKVLKSPEIPVTYSLVPQGIKGYTAFTPEWASWSMDKRIAEAKKLLEEAGYTESNPLSFTISYNTLESNKIIAVAIAAMWKRLGVKAQLFNKEVAVHYADMLSGKYEIGRGAWVADYVDPSSFIMLFTTLQASSTKEAMQNYKEAEQILLKTNAIIPLYNYVAKTLVKPWVKGYESNNMDLHRIKYMSISH